MSNLSLEITGLNELLRDADRAGANARTLVKSALTNSVNRIQSEARSLAPHKTGALQRSILTQVDYPNAKVEVNEKYGIFFEEGTGIYGKRAAPITPKRAKVLAWGSGGSMVFARSSKGIKPRPFFKPGIELSSDFIATQFTKVMEKLIDGLAGRR